MSVDDYIARVFGMDFMQLPARLLISHALIESPTTSLVPCNDDKKKKAGGTIKKVDAVSLRQHVMRNLSDFIKSGGRSKKQPWI